MIELPLFPLNTVLFPGMPLNLHIFEERYKLMINTCIEKRQAFGVVLIANHVDDTSLLAKPRSVGCTAQITQVQPLSEGRMNITAVGRERFQIKAIDRSHPYLIGEVEMFPIITEKPQMIVRWASRLRQYLDRYLEILQKYGQIQVDSYHLPSDANALGYLSAVLLQNISQTEKQSLLEFDKTTTMLQHLCALYRREILLLDVMVSPPQDIDFRDLYSLS